MWRNTKVCVGSVPVLFHSPPRCSQSLKTKAREKINTKGRSGCITWGFVTLISTQRWIIHCSYIFTLTVLRGFFSCPRHIYSNEQIIYAYNYICISLSWQKYMHTIIFVLHYHGRNICIQLNLNSLSRRKYMHTIIFVFHYNDRNISIQLYELYFIIMIEMFKWSHTSIIATIR